MQKACKAFTGSDITDQGQVMFRDTSFHSQKCDQQAEMQLQKQSLVFQYFTGV